MTFLKRRTILIFVALSLYFLAGCDGDRRSKRPPEASGRTVKIGIIAPMTGPDYPKGKDGMRGIKAILHRKPVLNNGDTVEILVENDKNEPELSVRAFKKLVDTEKVDAVLVLSPSTAVLELNKIADAYKTPVLATIASHQDIAAGTRYMNQLCIDNTFQGKVAALYARDELLITRAAVFEDSENEYSVSLARVFKDQFGKLGGSVFDPVSISGKKDELREQLTHLKQNDVELLYLPLNAKQFIFISKILGEIPWQPVRMGSDGLLSNVLVKHTQDIPIVNGSLSIDFYSTDASRSYFGRTLAKTYLRLFTETPTTYTIAAAEGFALILNAMERSHAPVTREDINNQIRNTGRFSGFIGRVKIGSDGKSQRPLIINAIEDGELKFLVRVH